MKKSFWKSAALSAMLAVPLLNGCCCEAADGDFKDHGIPVPVNTYFGCTSAYGDRGQNVALMLMADYRGLRGFYHFDLSDRSQYYVPLPQDDKVKGDTIFSSLYSTSNRYYIQTGTALWEYNPVDRRVRYWPTEWGYGMSMAEDDEGRVWCVCYPDCRLLCYDIKSDTFRDYGSLRKESWQQYSRTMAADDTGIMYFGIGITKGQICAFDPKTGKLTDLLPEDERTPQTDPAVFRATDGKVYAVAMPHYDFRTMEIMLKQARTRGVGPWYCLYRGEITKLDSPPDFQLKPCTTGAQVFTNLKFADGSRIIDPNVVEKTITYVQKGKEESAVMEYESGGAHISSLLALPDGRITGGSAFPMRNFVFDPADGSVVHRHACVQWNTMYVWKNHLFVGAYNGGWFVDWMVDKPWVEMPRNLPDAKINPVCLGNAGAPLIRPHALFCTDDGRYLVMGGTPAYGATGGALAIYDREAGKVEIVPNEELVHAQSIYSMILLPDGRIFGGTTIEAGTGGATRTTDAEIFQFDLKTRKMVRHEPVVPRTYRLREMKLLPDGRILCIADLNRLMIFEPDTWKMTELPPIPAEMEGIVWQQGPRSLIEGDGRIFVLGRKALGEFDPATGAVKVICRFPVQAGSAGAYTNGRIYFASGSRLCSVSVRK